MALGTTKFCEQFVWLDGRPISFERRPYLSPIYAIEEGNLVLRCARQTEKSTLLANIIIYEACINTDARILLVTPRDEQAQTFCWSRLFPMLRRSPVIRRVLLGKGHRLRVHDSEFSNGAQFKTRAAFHSADKCRGVSANLLMVDEFQDAARELEVMQETLSHAAHPRTILTGTPKLIDNPLEDMFAQSTANSWALPCSQCQVGITIDERCLGPTGLICPTCHSPLDPTQGSWVPRNPQSSWGQGFSISHPMVPWKIGKYEEEILWKQSTYDPVRFRNEVLGLPVSLGDHVVTRGELEACCGSERMLEHGDFAGLGRRQQLYCGIDWGGGRRTRTAVVIGIMRNDYVFEIKQISVLPRHEDSNRVLEEVSRICNHYAVPLIAADAGGNGNTYNRLLYPKLQHLAGFYSIVYSSEQKPVADGALWRWPVDRSRSIGTLFARVKAKKLVFPHRQDSDPHLDEFACQIADYDDHRRAVDYLCPEGQLDDVLHAATYALLIATLAHNAAQTY